MLADDRSCILLYPLHKFKRVVKTEYTLCDYHHAHSLSRRDDRHKESGQSIRQWAYETDVAQHQACCDFMRPTLASLAMRDRDAAGFGQYRSIEGTLR